VYIVLLITIKEITMEFKIDGITLYTCDKYGNKGRKIADNTSFASFDESRNIFIVTDLDGIVQTRDGYGNPIRKICENAIEARFVDKDIIVRTRNGNEQRDEYGNLIRKI
jgi:hypothetical protein